MIFNSTEELGYDTKDLQERRRRLTYEGISDHTRAYHGVYFRAPKMTMTGIQSATHDRNGLQKKGDISHTHANNFTEKMNGTRTSSLTSSMRTSLWRNILLTIFFVLLSSIFQDLRGLFIHPAGEWTRSFGGIPLAAAGMTTSKTNRICNGDMSFEKEITGSKFQLAKQSSAPVKFRFLRRNFLPNFPLKIVIYTEDINLINSLFIQAHDLELNQPVGNFNSTYSDKDITIISCGNDESSSDTVVTETTRYRLRSNITLYWNPPQNFKKPVVFRINTLTSDEPVDGWRGLTSYEILPKTRECISDDGSGYRGTMSQTKSGLPCQRWDSQTPHSHEFQGKQFAEMGLISDFCRRPNDVNNPWCFSTSTKTRDEACDVPKCLDDRNLENFMEFGQTAGDAKLERKVGQIGRINFTNEFPMIKANYNSAAVFEDGVFVLGKDSESLDHFHLHANGTFTVASNSSKVHSTAVIAPFWTKIHRSSTSVGVGYVFFRESSEPDVILTLRDVVNENLKVTGRTTKNKFNPSWAFIATWHLVSEDESETDIANLNSFQAILTTDGNRSFVLFNYNMKKWSEDNHTSLVGYKAGDGFRFLNHSLPNTKISELETASSLGWAITKQSNVNRPGQMMYELSICANKPVESRSSSCQDSLTLRLRPPTPKRQRSPARSPRRSDENINACGGSDCGDHGICDVFLDACVCDPGFTGAKCESNIDDCQSNPCQNGGNCTDGINQYTCTCQKGYTGTRCEDNINECYSSPCWNNGQCVDKINGYRCICASGFTGENCQRLVNQCESTPCKNGGTCNRTLDGYTCECAEGYSGQQCKDHICFNGMKCERSKRCIDKQTQKSNCTCQQAALTDNYCQPTPTTQPPECLPSITGSVQTGFVSWAKTPAGGVAISSCPTPTNSVASRKCISTIWEDPDTSACGTLSSRSIELDRLASGAVVAANASEIASQLVNITGSEPDLLLAYDISNAADVLDQIVAAVGTEMNFDTGNDVITCVSNLMEAPSGEMRVASREFASNSKLVKVVDNVLLKINVTTGENVFIQSTNIKVGVAGVSPNETFTGRTFFLSSELQPIISNFQENSEASASISLPPSITNSLAPGELKRLQFATYISTSLFEHVRNDSIWKNSSSTLYTDYVVSASVGNKTLTDLADGVLITIPRSNAYFGEGPYCVFYQFPADGGEGNWSPNGCRLRENNTDGVVCECDHLTNFAAIMDVYGTVEYLDEYTKMILSILTYVGCGLSIFGLLCTLVSYTIFQKIRKEAPAKILICLCLALIVVNVVYLCLQSAYYSTPTTCVAVAAIMHYALLSSLVWMGLEAVNMYIALVKVFNTYYRKYMLKMSLIGWGVPFLIVLSAFIVQFATGVPSYEMNSLTEICWLRRDVFYGTLVAPFAIIFLLNSVIYCLVLAQLLGMSSRKLKHMDSARKMRRPAKRESARKLRGAVGLMALLGISWGFALATIDKAALTFSYVFVVFNSSQGFWVFIFHCVLKKEVCKSWKKLILNEGKGFRDGSSRWSRFSSSNTRGSRSTSMSSTARSPSTSSIKTSYLVPKKSRSVSKSEASIGLDSKGLDVVTRTNSNGFSNPVFNEPDIGDPPPFPPPPIPVSEERVVRRVPKRVNCGPSNTIATQTDINLLGSRDTDSQNSIEIDANSQRYDSQGDEEDERRDSVDTNFGSRGMQHPFHREIVASPSNESGIYSDASVSSTAQLVESTSFVGVDNQADMTSRGRRNNVTTRHTMSRNQVISPNNNIAMTADNATNEVLTHALNQTASSSGVVNKTSHSHNRGTSGASLSDDHRCTDSGISITSGANSDDSPLTDRLQNGRPELQAQNSRSSLYSNYSNTSSVSAPSSASECATNQNPPSPHLWKAPLVIKRSEDHGNSIFSDPNFQRKPVVTSPQGAAKRTLWKKHRKHARSVDETESNMKETNLSPTRRRAKRKLPKSQSLEEERSSKLDCDVAVTNFTFNRANQNDSV